MTKAGTITFGATCIDLDKISFFRTAGVEFSWLSSAVYIDSKQGGDCIILNCSDAPKLIVSAFKKAGIQLFELVERKTETRNIVPYEKTFIPLKNIRSVTTFGDSGAMVFLKTSRANPLATNASVEDILTLNQVPHDMRRRLVKVRKQSTSQVATAES